MYEAKVGQDGRLEPMDKGAEFSDRLVRFVLQTAGKARGGGRVRINEVHERREPKEQHDQSLLGAVMEVVDALSALGGRRSRCPRLDHTCRGRPPLQLRHVTFSPTGITHLGLRRLLDNPSLTATICAHRYGWSLPLTLAPSGTLALVPSMTKSAS